MFGGRWCIEESVVVFITGEGCLFGLRALRKRCQLISKRNDGKSGWWMVMAWFGGVVVIPGVVSLCLKPFPRFPAVFRGGTTQTESEADEIEQRGDGNEKN